MKPRPGPCSPGPRPSRCGAARRCIRGADRLRTSLVPSLLGVRRTNESLSNPEIELFEIAKIYLPSPGLPEEWWMLGITSGRPYAEVKGVVEAIVAAIDPSA